MTAPIGSPEGIAAAVERVKREVTEDVASGVIPTTVADFSDLHSYVDANMYGGEDMDALWEGDGSAPNYAAVNAVQDAVEAWIKTGALLTLPTPACTHCGAHLHTRRGQWLSSDDSGWCGDEMEQQHAIA